MGKIIDEYKDIKLQQECVSKTIDNLWKMVLKYREIEMGMTLDETIKRYKNNAEYERTHGNLQGCLEFRQLAKWLEKLQKIMGIINSNPEYIHHTDMDTYKVNSIREVLEDGDVD